VEQIAALRAIPNLTVIRPGDANETAVAWRVALETHDRPVVLVLSRQNLPTLDRSRYAPADGLRRGAYVLLDPPGGTPELILIASGSEVGLIVAAAQRLQGEGIAVRCISMPSWELFDALPQAERDIVLPPSVSARLAVEAGVAQGWQPLRWRGRRRTNKRGAIRRIRASGGIAARIRLYRRQRLRASEGATGME
jgi:transketolase